jgi:multidrug efflux pump subunit AcrA (membrane-fusion protein)
MSTRALRSIAFFLLIVSSACSSQTGGDPSAGGGGGRDLARGGAAVPVVTARIEKRAVPVLIPAVGTVEAVASVQIRSQVTGQLSAIHFDEGDEVRKGQPLFRLDSRPFQAALQQAEAVLARDTATAKNAQAQRGRFEDLFKRGLIPRDQFEAQIASASALEATVAADQAAVENARLSLQFASINSPIAGRTGALGVHVGDLVRANDTIPLVIINQLSPIYVTFSVPGRFLAEIRRYQARKPLRVVASVQGAVAPGAQPPPASGSGSSPSPGGLHADGRAAAGTVADTDPTPPGGAGPSGGVGSRVSATGSVSFIDNSVDPTTGTIRLN